MEEDIIIDIPKFWEYIGEVLAPIVINLTQNRKQFLNEVTKCKADKRSMIVAKVFHAISILTVSPFSLHIHHIVNYYQCFKDSTKAHELFVNSDLRWSELLGANANIDEFVRNHVSARTDTHSALL